jgi:hypothetical protein
MVMEIEVGGAEFGGRAEWRKGVGGKCDGAGISEIFAPTARSETAITLPDVFGRNAHGTARREVEPYKKAKGSGDGGETNRG